MNKIIFIFFLFVSILFANNINEQKVDLFFGNGIDTSFKDALKTTDKLNNVLLGRNLALRDTFFNKDIIDNTYDIYKYNINLAYNNTFGFLYDVYEAGMQKDITLGCYLTTRDSLEEQIKLAEMTQEAKDQLLLKIANGETNCNIMKGVEEYDITTQLNGYKKSLNQGHRVMALVHSQGNLFLNEVGKRLEIWEKEYIEAYGIATPADTLFKTNNEASLNNYITSDQDIINNVGLDINYTLTETEKSIYDIELYDFFSGHFIMNYLQIPSTRDLVVQGIEGKTQKLLNLPSLFKFTSTANYCEQIPIIHKYKEESYLGLVFNENGKVNSIGNNVVMNNRYLNGVIELIQDPINCYSDLDSIDFIKRKKGLEQEISILNIENKGYVIKGEMNGYETEKTYIGEITNTETGEKIESIRFTKLTGNYFEVSFPMKTKGNFYFKLKNNFKQSNEVFISIQEKLLSDNLSLSKVSNVILLKDFFDINAINYKFLLKDNLTNDILDEKIVENVSLTTEFKFDLLKAGDYIVELEKENIYGEKITLSRNQNFTIEDLEKLYLKNFYLSSEVKDIWGVNNTYSVFANISLNSLDSGIKVYLINKNNGIKYSYSQKINLGSSYLNGASLSADLIIEDKVGNIIIKKNDFIQINNELSFFYEPKLFMFEDCKDINKSSFRIDNTTALNENLFQVFTNGNIMLESTDNSISGKYIYNQNLVELKEINLRISNTLTNKEKSFIFNVSFNPENTKCKDFKNPFITTTEKNSKGTVIKVKYKTNYLTGEITPGKLEYVINGVVKKIYFMGNINDLINNPDNQEFEVDGTKPVKVEVKIYDMYKGTYLVKNYSTQIVY